MTKKKVLPTRTFKVTTEYGREYRVYATGAAKAIEVFEKSKPEFDLRGNPITLVVEKVEEDPEEWTTTLFEGRKAPGA
jgi:hypothetical protein